MRNLKYLLTLRYSFVYMLITIVTIYSVTFVMKLEDYYLNTCVGNKIKKIRVALAMTEEQLANQVGTTAQNILQYESGIVSVPVNTFFLISRTFNVSVMELLSDYFNNSDYRNAPTH